MRRRKTGCAEEEWGKLKSETFEASSLWAVTKQSPLLPGVSLPPAAQSSLCVHGLLRGRVTCFFLLLGLLGWVVSTGGADGWINSPVALGKSEDFLSSLTLLVGKSGLCLPTSGCHWGRIQVAMAVMGFVNCPVLHRGWQSGGRDFAVMLSSQSGVGCRLDVSHCAGSFFKDFFFNNAFI